MAESLHEVCRNVPASACDGICVGVRIGVPIPWTHDAAELSPAVFIIIARHDRPRRSKSRSIPPIGARKSVRYRGVVGVERAARIDTIAFGHDRGGSRHLASERSFRR
ncbi:hypothetical protein [Burkholderia vietnamiensis]|uniref:hypothetical protein n=1 Tax=Burkholderia vietnamiensis TaxID=60552 RepID=UPI0012D9FF63|nr:hypothetical protein [Burkholderia vietnamiensis]